MSADDRKKLREELLARFTNELAARMEDTLAKDATNSMYREYTAEEKQNAVNKLIEQLLIK